MTFMIKQMDRSDKPALMKLLAAIPEFTPSEVAVAEEVIDSYLAGPSDYHLQVAELDTTVVGYICYGRTPLTESTWDIYWMAVSPEHQQQGVGSALLKFAEAKIGEAGGRLIVIETSSKPEYEKTRRFHLRHGYRSICRIADFYALGDDKLILTKRWD
jgi:GNAT superfamily N-acetyltransferase